MNDPYAENTFRFFFLHSVASENYIIVFFDAVFKIGGQTETYVIIVSLRHVHYYVNVDTYFWATFFGIINTFCAYGYQELIYINGAHVRNGTFPNVQSRRQSYFNLGIFCCCCYIRNYFSLNGQNKKSV